MENLTGASMREYANFIHALSTRTASRNSSNFQSHVQCWIYEGRKGKQEIMFCLRPGLTSEWSVFKKLCILLYACLVMFTFAECSPSPRRKVFSFHNTDPRDIISLLFMPAKEGLYLHASLLFFFLVYQSSLDVTG